MLMLKANAYGHGLCEVAKATADVVDMFGVETLEEGIAIRRACIGKDVLVLALQPCEVKSAIEHCLTIGVHNVDVVNMVADFANRGLVAKTHIKLDSGMHRLGLDPMELDCVLDLFKKCDVNVSGIYSHLRDDTISQKADFEKLACRVKSIYPNVIMHLASSHSLKHEAIRYDMARVGISAYKGAMSAKSIVIDARFVHAGEKIGYGNFSLDNDSNIAVIFGGYADGISREHPPCVYINGIKCKPVGNACMDVFIVDTGQYRAKPYESVIIFDQNTIDDYANEQNTIDYCVMTALNGRVKRCYNAEIRSEKNCQTKGFIDDDKTEGNC